MLIDSLGTSGIDVSKMHFALLHAVGHAFAPAARELGFTGIPKVVHVLRENGGTHTQGRRQPRLSYRITHGGQERPSP